ncbi:MAG: FHA domain-containing protein [Isosphaeraceae bacterium]|nr:FHA domain-containing protein [Isosphaeraceae bacterium]
MLRAANATSGGETTFSGPRLVVANDAHAIDRRMENWVACALDDPSRPAARDGWHRVIDGLPARNRAPKPGRRGSNAGWARFRTAYRRGITVVHVMERNLVKPNNVGEIEEDLLALIDAGYHRIVLDFSVVERLTSWVVGAVARAHQRCAAAEFGRLKVCGLRAQVATIFAITGLASEINIEPDEATALESPWPQPAGLRPLPLDILSALIQSAESADPLSRASGEEFPPMPDVWLLIQVGRSKGKAVAVVAPRFVIGRDARCQLRPASEAVSRLHACIEQRAGRVVLRDLGSTNGTFLNGTLLQGDEAELHAGDRIRLGPLEFTVAFGPPRTPAVDEQVTNWLQGTSAGGENSDPTEPETANFPLLDGTEAHCRIKHEIVEDVLVVTPLATELDDESTIGPLRKELQALFGRALPRRVVVNLEYVTHITGQAIGLFVAHHLRLDRAGGALRVGGVHARVMALLDQVRLPVLMDCYPSVDAAVLDPWPSAAVAR